MYIYHLPNWPNFTWDKVQVLEALTPTKYALGLLLGKITSFGFDYKNLAVLDTLMEDVIKSSEIEGEILNKEQVRSSIAKRLGLDVGGNLYIDRHVDGIVEMMLDATQNYHTPLTQERLFGWHAALFPTGYSRISKIQTGQFRDDSHGAMQVVSGPLGKEKVHFQAPPASCLSEEVSTFIHWFNTQDNLDELLKAGICHLWFVTLHPFDDGNGRIARALTDMILARADQSPQRFYSMSSQIYLEKKQYYDILEKTQKGPLDITPWLIWFQNCLAHAIAHSESTLRNVFEKAAFWQRNETVALNNRQRLILNKLLDGFEGHLTSSKWALICKCSQDTANRDITDLLNKQFLTKSANGRNTHYTLKSLPQPDIT